MDPAGRQMLQALMDADFPAASRCGSSAAERQLGEGAALRIAPELADPPGALEVGEHQDVEQLGAGSGTEGVQALPESAFQLIGAHGGEATL